MGGLGEGWGIGLQDWGGEGEEEARGGGMRIDWGLKRGNGESERGNGRGRGGVGEGKERK